MSKYIEIKCSKCNELLGFHEKFSDRFISPSGVVDMSWTDNSNIFYFCKSCKQLMKLKE